MRVHVEGLDVAAADAPERITSIAQRYGAPHALVSNAAIVVSGAIEEQSDADVRDQFETNALGLMRVTRAVLPSMRAAGRGRIINVTSLQGRFGLPGTSVYAATKHAVEGFSEGLRWEVKPFGIDVCIVEPGIHRTPMFFENQRQGDGVSSESPYVRLTRALDRLVVSNVTKAPPPDAVARAHRPAARGALAVVPHDRRPRRAAAPRAAALGPGPRARRRPAWPARRRALARPRPAGAPRRPLTAAGARALTGAR
ncbi:SDR family NAD(P)-dependent oxidoreductase [Sorangium sp. So ce296]|uniref:SDR family NAD(P)-dependent oxidoreductase n=1 Tax=Sorangium sp. So ce296 TaxID=3133296 RepID=UPI003F600D9F